MGWKQKEKELSVEEAVVLAKRELEPYWIGSKPKMIGIKSKDQFILLPLDAEFSQKPWLIFCIDLTEFTSESVFYFVKEWNRRYFIHGLLILIVIMTFYSYLKQPEFIANLREKKQLDIPFVIDIQETLFPAFNVARSMKILLQQGTIRHFEHDQITSFKQSEAEIQRFLRSTDPGLCLLPLLQPSQPIQIDESRFEFGYRPKLGETINYTSGSFSAPDESGERIGIFQQTKMRLESGEFYLLGEWSQNAERILTRDPHAQICFYCPSSELGIVAQASSHSTVSVEINGNRAYDTIMGAHLALNETASSIIQVDQPILYHALTRLPTQANEITLRFPNADKAPIEIFGLRFGGIQ